jgi:peptidoglycan/LPS O-acetylase OafA/YrhL
MWVLWSGRSWGWNAVATDTGRYLPFIDGLRAVAILSVVACHIGIPGFSGGYVGVDVFFVISGFLIINQIKDQLTAGTFSILGFYARRTLRIHPPFIVMLLVVFIAAPVFLPTPGVYQDFGRSAVLAPIMLVNFVFYLKQGYFDIGASEKPLLHTWTLAVEEQFYLVAPFVLLAAFHFGHKRFGRRVALVAAALFAVSFVGCVFRTSSVGPNAAFYFMHWRIWEFVAGGIIGAPLVELARKVPFGGFWSLVGAGGIVSAVVLFDANTLFPSWRAAFPAFGAGLVILFGLSHPSNVVARALSIGPMRFIGLVSYSWYLWHWPLLALVRISRLGEPSLLVDCLTGGAAGFAMACLSYRYIEIPIRDWRRRGIAWPSGKIFATGLSAGISTAMIGGLVAFLGNIWLTNLVASTYGVEGTPRSRSVCKVTDSSMIPQECMHGRLAVLLGDSHAAAMFDSLARNVQSLGSNLIYVGRGGCDPLLFADPNQPSRYRCADLLSAFAQMLAQHPATVILTPAWVGNNRNARLWHDLFAQFDPTTRILVIGLPPPMNTPTLACVVLSDRYLGSRDRCTVSRAQADAARNPIMDAIKAGTADLANVKIINPLPLFCDAQTCRPFSGNQVYYKDQSHLETPGVDLIQQHFDSEFRWAMGLDK